MPRPVWLLHDTLLESAARCPRKVAIIDAGREVTYAELLASACGLAHALRARGIGTGDRVAIREENGVRAAAAVYGTLLSGAAFSLYHPDTKLDRLEYCLEDSGAKALVTSLPAPAGAEVVGDWEPAATAPAIDTLPVDLAALTYTSGSTGKPKGVMMPHRSMVFVAQSIASYLRLSEEDRIFNALPLSFNYGLYQLLMSVMLGTTLVLERSFLYPGQIIKVLTERAATVFPAVPTVFSTLLALHRRNGLTLPGITRVTNAGAALPASLVPELTALFPNALVFKMYGQTECTRISYLEPEELARRPRSVGKAIPGTSVYLLSEEGKPVAPGEVGILHVRGPHLMAGYWNRPDLSAETLRPGPLPGEQVLCTRDRFKMDAEGYLYFVGRTDDIIKSRGEKVSPVEVEDVLHKLPQVRAAAVVGIPDERLGEAICAYVVLASEGALGEREIRAHCEQHLEGYKVPQLVRFIDKLPVSSNGKVARRLLLETNKQ